MPPDFVQKTVDAFSKIKGEIDEKGGELDFRYSLATCFLRDVLGWTRKKGEGHFVTREREDILLFDDSNRCVALVETKNPKIKLGKAHREELKRHLDDTKTARYGALTNGHLFQLFEYSIGGELGELASIDISSAVGRGAESLSKSERQDIYLLRRLMRDRFVGVKPEYFIKTVQKVPVEKKFDLFIENLRESLDDLTRIIDRFFRFYQESGPEHYGGKFLREEAFPKWKGTSTGKEEELREKFCKETTYVFLNRILFTRILEDKEIVPRLISGEEFAKSLRMFGESAYEMVLTRAYENVEKFYKHFYELGIFDWWRLPEDKRGLLSEEEEKVQEEIERDLNTIIIRDVLRKLNQFNFREVGRDILGRVYEKYLPPAERKRLGEFYTPIEVVRYILDAVGYIPDNKIEDKLLLDPACGSGTFLVEASKRLMKRYDKKGLRLRDPGDCETILDAITSNIHGLDINPFACHIAEMNLLFNVIDLLYAAQRTGYKLKRFNISCTDSLVPPEEETAKIEEFVNGRLKIEAEEKQQARETKKKQFDFVVGNPPWGGILKREKGTLLDRRLRDLYVSATGKYDIYVIFIEKGIRWLKKGGKFGYIVQNRFLRADYGKKLREYILQTCKINKIVDFGDTKIFADATNYPCIITFEKISPKENKIAYIEISKEADALTPDEVINFVKSLPPESKNYLSVISVWQKELKHISVWVPSQIRINSIFGKVGRVKNLGELSKEIMQGVTFGGKGSDSVFCINKKVLSRFGIENKLCKKVVKGRDIQKWRIEWTDRFLVYPYDLSGKRIDLKRYPNTLEYLKQFQNKLENRELDGKNILKWGKVWYSFWRARNPQIFEGAKIVSPRLSTTNRFTLDPSGNFYITDSAICIVPKNLNMKYILGLLNSNLLTFFVKNTSPFVQGRYYSYSRTYLERLPIKLPQSAKEKRISDVVVRKVSQVLQFSQELNNLEKKIENFPEPYTGKNPKKLADRAERYNLTKDKYKISHPKVEKSGKGLYKLSLDKDNYITFASRELAEYVLEWLRRRKRVRRRELLGLEVPSEKEVVKVMKEFSGDRKRVEELKGEVKRLEGEINELVYELYGLDAKDRKVIEEFLEKF